MAINQLVFYVFAVLAVLSALMVILQNNPVRSVLALVVTFLTTSVIWLLNHAEFLGLILILVYVGAVMTLFLFVVMMLNIDIAEKHKKFWRNIPFILLGAGLFVYLTLYITSPAKSWFATYANGPAARASADNSLQLGQVLYTQYAYALEIAAVLLVIAIITAISLVHRAPRNCKTQDVVAQIKTRREDRIKLIDMPPETDEES